MKKNSLRKIVEQDSLRNLLINNQDKFITVVSKGAGNNSIKAKAILNWLSHNMDWLATDYKQRTVQEIIERGGGNCHELAMVTLHLYDLAGVQKRKVKEINIQAESQKRQKDAEERINEVGNKASVFGKRHNDHVWLEVYDNENKIWIPVDPTMNIFGMEQWIASRIAFNRKATISPFSKDMLLPVAIFALDNETSQFINRSEHYLVDEFNSFYDGKLTNKKNWGTYMSYSKEVSKYCLSAFEGKTNLHEKEEKLFEVYKNYESIKKR